MSLPHVDFELMYWRARRRLQRVRAAYRAYVTEARAQAHLHYLCAFGRMPERPEPEETIVYRGLWFVAVLMLVGVVAVEAIGQDAVAARIESAGAKFKGVPERAVLRAAARVDQSSGS